MNGVHDTVYIKVVVCSSCQSVLDAQSGRVLAEQRQKLKGFRFADGAQGTLRGKRVMLIGAVRYKDQQNASWDEYTLIDEDGAYRSLTVDEGHFLLVRELPRPPIGAAELSMVKTRKERVKIDGKFYLADEPQKLRVVCVRGQHNFLVKPDDRFTEIEAFRPPDVISIVPQANEFAEGEWLHPDEVNEAFGRTFDLPQWGHAAQPVWRSLTQKIVTYAMLVLSIAACVGALYVEGATSIQTVFSATFDRKELEDGALSREFELKPSQVPTVAKITVSAPSLSNNWVYLELKLIDSDGFVVISSGQEVSYYYGVEGGESWSEGGKSEYEYVRLTKPGRYRLLAGGEVDRYRPFAQSVHVAVTIGYALTRWLWIAALLLLIYPIFVFFRWRRLHRQGWDEVDDDDDDD
ncbi:MAG: DUF4178 domain-containing protein [Myxococcales bacterium]|nr:DUF4178 domain-containing protein [Myxococcales bacterium]